MGFEVIRVAHGEPAVACLADRVQKAKADAGDALAPVTVVVPSNYAAVAVRRELARRGGVVGVVFLTLFRLAERLGAAALAAVGRRPVSAPVVLQTVRGVLSASPGVLAPVAEHPATSLALAAARRELAGLGPAALDALASQSPRAADVIRIIREVDEALRPCWYDEHDLLGAATTVVGSGSIEGLGSVIVHLPERLSPGSTALLQSLSSRVPVTVLLGASGVDAADRPVVAAFERVGAAVPPGDVERPRAKRIVSASDPDEEVRAAVRLVVAAARDGVPLGRMAVLFGAADPYARLLREQLDAAGIAANGTPVRSVGDMLAGRVLRGLLALPDRRFRRSDVLSALAATHVPLQEWERLSRAAGVVEGDDWRMRLATFADERWRQADEAAAAHALSSCVADLKTVVAAGEERQTWRELASWASDLLARYLPADRSAWPEAEQGAADRVEAAIDQLAGLDGLGGPPPTVEVFRRLLDGELEAALPRVGRFGEGVLVGPLSLAVGLTLDRVIIVGLAEGTFPDRRLDDSLLPDRERSVVGGELALRSEHVHDDHRHLLAGLAAGPATVCFPRGDLRQPGERTASRWLLDDASALAGVDDRIFTADLHALGSTAPWLEVVPSFTSGIRRSAFPATGQEHRLATLLQGEGRLASRPLTKADPILAAGAAMAEARRSDGFTRFDGNLGVAGVGPLAIGDRPHSATRLQTWAACPHAYFLEYVLGVEPVDEPERRLRLDPLDKGWLVHETLQRFVAEGSGDRSRLLAIGADVCDEYAARGRTGRQLFWRRDRAQILADLERFFDEDAAWRSVSGATTIATEQGFDAVVLSGVRVRGTIDRIDRLPDGRLVVLDYKTGKSDRYRGLSEDDPHQGGTRLQPFLYSSAVGATRFDYWFVTRAGGFQRIGYEVDEAVAEEVGGAVATIVDGIRRGIFPRRPPETPGWNRVDCWFCAPDGLSAAEARRDWERKRGNAALAAYVGLCEPGGDDGDE